MKYVSIFLLLVVAGCGTTQQLQERPQDRTWETFSYPAINNFEKPDVEIFELDNGITFYLVEDDELPLINLNVIVRTGGVSIPVEKEGLASITGTVMRTGGSVSLSGDELNELLEDRAGSMETSIGFTSGSARMNVLKEDFDTLIPVFADLIRNPAFPQERIDLAKTQQKSAISRRNDSQAGIANREFRKLIYGDNSVYASTTEYATIDAFTREDMVEFHRNSFTGQNLMIGVIGDFSMDEMKQTLSEVFGDFPAGTRNELYFPEITYDFPSTINFVDKRDVNQSYVLLGHIGGTRDNPDYAKIQVMNRVLSGGFSSRLFQVVRSELGLAYSVFGTYGSGNFFPGTFTAGVMTRSDATADAIEAIIEQIERLQNEPITQEELDQTIDQFLNSLVFRYTSRASVLFERMNNDYAGLDPDTFDRLVEEIRAVTVEDVQEVAQKYFRPNDVQILVVGHGEEIGDQLERFGPINKIDITIPRPGQAQAPVAAGDAARGAELVTKVKNAVIPGGTLSGTLVQEGRTEVNTPMGAMNIGMKYRINFTQRAYDLSLDTPQGQVRFDIRGNEGTLHVSGQQMPMQPAQIQQQVAQFNSHYLNLLLKSNSFDITYTGNETVNGVQTEVLRLQGDETYKMFINPSTGLPVKVQYSQFNSATGSDVVVEMHYSDWNVSGGVALAYTTKSIVDGNEQATEKVTSHSVE